MKNAKTIYDIHPNLNKRWSPRAFENKTVEPEKIQCLFEAARWTPSAFNVQPWSFILGLNKDETYQKIYECLVEFNQNWTKFAPVLVVSVGQKIANGKENTSYRYDVGQSVAHLSFQAMEEDLYVHQMTGFDPEKARKNFDIPEEYEAISAFAIGYLGDPEILEGGMKEAELAKRERKEFKTLVFENKFGQPSELFR